MTRRRGKKESNRRVSASPRPPVPLITLLTDFGTSDYFVSAMKGVILSLSPNARIVDITHDIAAQDIEAAAFTLLAAYPCFPTNTIHVAVVDPGVGSSRRAILVKAGANFFLGPDNGIFSYIYEREPEAKVFELTNQDYFRHPVSSTFQGRDVFAPVAAALANGVGLMELGREIMNPVSLEPLASERLPVSRDSTKGKSTKGKVKEEKIRARIIHIDRFGNCITNLTPTDLSDEMVAAGAYVVINRKKISSFRKFFAEQTVKDNELFCVWGSAGFLEIAATNRSAAKILKARRGQLVVVSRES